MSRAQVNLLNWGFPFPDDSIAHAAAARLSLSVLAETSVAFRAERRRRSGSSDSRGRIKAAQQGLFDIKGRH